MTNTMQHNAAKSKSSLANLRMLVLATLAAILAFAVVPGASAQVTLINRKLVNTNFETQPNSLTASCSVSKCTALLPAFPVLNTVCPVAAGASCTFYIHLEASSTSVASFDGGLFQFLVNGAAPTPGPTLTGGKVYWYPTSSGYAVAAQVTNTTANQVWPIAVSFGCIDSDPTTTTGCISFFGPGNLAVSVYTP